MKENCEQSYDMKWSCVYYVILPSSPQIKLIGLVMYAWLTLECWYTLYLTDFSVSFSSTFWSCPEVCPYCSVLFKGFPSTFSSTLEAYLTLFGPVKKLAPTFWSSWKACPHFSVLFKSFRSNPTPLYNINSIRERLTLAII